MTRFHTDEYVHFLSRVTPETAEDLTYHGTRCEWSPSRIRYFVLSARNSPCWGRQPCVGWSIRLLFTVGWRVNRCVQSIFK